MRYHVPPNISGHYLPQRASNPYVHGHPIAQAAVPIIPKSHVCAAHSGARDIGTTNFQRQHPTSSGREHPGSLGGGKLNNHNIRPTSGADHKQINRGRKRPHPNNFISTPKQYGRKFQYSDHSGARLLSDCTRHRLSSTSSATETPRGVPVITHQMVEEIRDETGKSGNSNPQDRPELSIAINSNQRSNINKLNLELYFYEKQMSPPFSNKKMHLVILQGE